ncbi:MAG: polysaccharide biosynthesis/export family protein [Acidobacteriota bacterium]
MSRSMGVAHSRVVVLGVLMVLAAFNLAPLATAQSQNVGKQPLPPPGAANTPAPNVVGGAVDVTTFVLGPGDVIAVKVFGHPELSESHRIRTDGIISIPLMGEIQAAGLTPQKLSKQIEQALSETLQLPIVNLDVIDVQSKVFTLIGAVARPGQYPMANPITIFEAINFGLGFGPYAKSKKITVIRMKDGVRQTLNFNYEDYKKGKNLDKNPNFMVENKDTIIVPE